MKNKENLSWLWLFISIFLVIWVGNQLIGVFNNLEILNLRTTDIVTFEKQPLWFIFVVTFKSAFFVGCIAYIYIFLKRFKFAK